MLGSSLIVVSLFDKQMLEFCKKKDTANKAKLNVNLCLVLKLNTAHHVSLMTMMIWYMEPVFPRMESSAMDGMLM